MDAGPLWLLSYKQQSLAYCNMCYLLWSKVRNQPDVKDTLHKLHANYVLVPVDRTANIVIVACKKYYIDNLVKRVGITNVNSNNPTYILIDDSFETIMNGHDQFIISVGLKMSEEDQNLPYLYWLPKLHLQKLYDKRPVMPPHQAIKYHKGRIGEVLQQ